MDPEKKKFYRNDFIRMLAAFFTLLICLISVMTVAHLPYSDLRTKIIAVTLISLLGATTTCLVCYVTALATKAEKNLYNSGLPRFHDEGDRL